MCESHVPPFMKLYGSLLTEPGQVATIIVVKSAWFPRLPQLMMIMVE